MNLKKKKTINKRLLVNLCTRKRICAAANFQKKRGPAIAKFPLTFYRDLAVGSREEFDLLPIAWGHIFNLF